MKVDLEKALGAGVGTDRERESAPFVGVDVSVSVAVDVSVDVDVAFAVVVAEFRGRRARWHPGQYRSGFRPEKASGMGRFHNRPR